MRDHRAPVSSPVTPTPKGRNFATETEDEVTRDASGVDSQTITSDKPTQPDVETCGPGSHAEGLHQAQAQSHSPDLSKPIPFRIPPSTEQPEGSQDGDPFGDAGLNEAVDIARGEQETEETGSSDVVGENAILSALIDAGQAGNTVMDDFVAPNVIDQEPHEQTHEQLHEEQVARNIASVLVAIEAEPEKKKTAGLGAIDADMQNTPLSQLQHQSPNQSLGTLDAQPASPRGKQVEEAPAEPKNDYGSAKSSLNAPNGLVTIPIPPHYHEVRKLLWFKKTIAESQPAPRTPSPMKPTRKASGTSGARRTRKSKKTPSKAPAVDDDAWSPPHSRGAKKAAKAAETAATQAASPAPRKTPIKKITLHFTRKPKVDTDDDAAPKPQPDPEEESNQESQRTSDESDTRGSAFWDGDADELEADAENDGHVGEDADVDAEEEVMLL